MVEIQEHSKCPVFLQTDCGTETGLLAAIHSFIWQDRDAHRFGTSTSNQRIECFWSFLKKSFTHWVIEFFRDFVHSGVYSPGNVIHTECAWFCFSKILQSYLTNVVNDWNSHYIRKSRCYTVPGTPDELYHVPEESGFHDYAKILENHTVLVIAQELNLYRRAENILNGNEEDIQQYFLYVVQSEDLRFPPSNIGEARALFTKIIRFCN